MKSAHTVQQNASKVSFRRIFMIAIPVMLANIAMPLQGLVDVAISARLGDASLLAGLGLAVQLLSVLMISFNFLQYSSSGLTAQALGGAADASSLLAILQRALLLATVIGLLLFVLQTPLITLGLSLLSASASASAAASDYLHTRFFGIIAELCNFVFVGFLAGLARTRQLLIVQTTIALVNIALSLIFVQLFHLGLSGIALGTVLAQWLGVLIFMAMIARILSVRFYDIIRTNRQLFSAALFKLLSLNKDIFIRTLLLTLSFAWITRLAAMHGDVFLAATMLLLQVLSISAYALDGLAVAAETLSGQAAGSGSKSQFTTALVRTGVSIVLLACALSAAWYGGLQQYLLLLAKDDAVLTTALQYAPFAAALPIVGAWAYWLDGVYFGLTAGVQIRRAAIIVAVLFFSVSGLLHAYFGEISIWLSVLWLLLARFLVLAALLPSTMRLVFD